MEATINPTIPQEEGKINVENYKPVSHLVEVGKLVENNR